jgi:DNA repair exonuclease SbcCD nuclease subunit
MSNTFFKKAAVFGDIHFGLKNNSKIHNQDCYDFLEWFCEQAKKENCETCIFLGDWNHQRNAINISTLKYGYNGLKLLSENFENIYMITGNHDLYYREKRDLYSFPFAELFPNITVINDKPLIEKDVAFVPWLVEDEWKSVKNIKSKYIFGHFELPKFMMNALVEMPDHNGLKKEDLNKAEYVFSGHFHKRQNSDNVYYIGSPFGHNYADAWDDDRGMMVLEWDSKPRFINWESGPTYITITLSQVSENTDDIFKENMYAKISLDLPVSYEEANYVKEALVEQYKLRELKLIPHKTETNDFDTDGIELKIENVDKIVFNQIQTIDSDFINKDKLLEIYSKL